jgi:hypothetical protein
VHPHPAAVAYSDAGRLLTPVLESEEGEERHSGGFFVRSPDAKDPALFFRMIVKAPELHS